MIPMHTSDIKIERMKEKHLPELWTILQDYPGYFDEDLSITSLERFTKWFKRYVVYGVVGIVDGKVVGCGYIDYVHSRQKNGCVGVFVKPKTIPFNVMVPVFKEVIENFTAKLNLKMLYGVVDKRNRKCLIMSKYLGFRQGETLEMFKKVGGVLVDCVVVTYIPKGGV